MISEKIYEVEDCAITYKLNAHEELVLNLLAIVEDSKLTFESYKEELIRSRREAINIKDD